MSHTGIFTRSCAFIRWSYGRLTFLNVFQVQEGMPAGSLLGTLQAKDPDEGENGTIFYSLSGNQTEIL